ncbi:MAG: hypothetical protein RLZZ502_1806 [Pseudomonadota bacterium]
MQQNQRLLSLTWPVLIELLLAFTVSTAGMWLAGKHGGQEQAVYSLGNQVFHFFFILFRVISMGLSVVVSQYLGARNHEAARATAFAAIGANTAMAFVLISLLIFGAPWWLSGLNTPSDILPRSQAYLYVLAMALLLDSYLVSFAAVLRAHLHSRHTMLIAVLAQTTHLLFAYLLMHYAGLGVMGFALAMIASRVLGVLLVIKLWRTLLNYHPQFKDCWQLTAIQRALLTPVLAVGIPGAVEAATYRFAVLVTVALVGALGTEALALHAAVFQCASFGAFLVFALGFAAELKLGHLIGAGEFKRAYALVKTALWVCILLGVGMGLISALLAPISLKALSQPDKLLPLGQTLMFINIALEIGRASNILLVNALRAVGDARFTLHMSVPTILFFMAGGAWLFTGQWQWGLIGIWLAYTIDELVRGAVNAYRWFSLAWLPRAIITHKAAQIGKTTMPQ